MKKIMIFIVTDEEKDSLSMLLDYALKSFSIDYEFSIFEKINTQLELEKLLKTIDQYKDEKMVFHLFSNRILLNYLENFCDLNKISNFDFMSPVQVAISNALEIKNLSITSVNSQFLKRIDAINFAYRYDDGKSSEGLLYADIIILGISRTFKTPLSIYLANKGYRVINIPLVPESTPPKELFTVNPSKVIGLTSNVNYLKKIRKERLNTLGLPQNSSYASEERILAELGYANGIMKSISCPIVDVSNKAIEETADIIIRHISK